MNKIMFNDRYGLTEAVLQGLKTKTRRLCKEYLHDDIILADEVESWLFYSDENLVEFVLKNGSVKVSVPPYKVGEVVAVAQAYKNIFHPLDRVNKELYGKGWSNKMFVRADRMPHRIIFTDLKLERLQDIRDEDCMREGVLYSNKYAMPFGIIDIKAPNGVLFYYSSPREAFADLIDKVSGKGTWKRNPYVYAYSFELVQEGGNQ